MNFNIKKIINNVILVSAITIFIFVIIFAKSDFKEIIATIKTTNLKYFMISVLVLLVYCFVQPLPLYILSKANGCDVKFLDIMLLGTTEHFFNGITPFSTGGQPFQVYAFNEIDVKPSTSTGVLMMNFIIYQFVLNVFCFITVFIFYGKIQGALNNLKYLIIFGFSMNILVFAIFLSLATVKSVKKLFTKFLTWLCKFKFFKKFLETKIPAFEQYVEGAQAAFKQLFSMKLKFICCLVIKTFSLLIFYAIPYFIMIALGVDLGINQLFFIISMTSFALTMVVWFPTPGGSGGIELAFKTLFASIAGVTASVALSGMLLWRLLTYYLLMIIGFLAFLLFEKRRKKIV